MSTNHTTNYDLNQWEGTDKVLRAEFNADNAKIDAALKANADAIAAEAAAREAGVSGKADQSALSAERSARQAADEALEAALESLGNCQMELFTYTGDGTYGPDSKSSVTFSVRPEVYIIAGCKFALIGRGGQDDAVLVNGYNGNDTPVSWSGNKLTYYSSRVDYQLNLSGETYWVLGLRRKS